MSLRSQRIVYKKGCIAPLWPKEYGGPGWSVTQRFIFEQETSRAGTLPPLAFSGTMVGPVIYTCGNEAQKRKFLPRILSGEDWWCQGYSEPGSGSDLASVRTRAVRDGDHYVVNGHKTWTTLAQHADWIFCLVRTDPAAKPQARSEEHTSELQSRVELVCRLLLEKKKKARTTSKLNQLSTA